jgi:hypothetical protein
VEIQKAQHQLPYITLIGTEATGLPQELEIREPTVFGLPPTESPGPVAPGKVFPIDSYLLTVQDFPFPFDVVKNK